MKSTTAFGYNAFSAILTPSVTWLMITLALWSKVSWPCGFTLLWFSVKKAGFAIFPISWYMAPVRTSCAFAPIFAAASDARIETCRECWNVPGDVSDNFLRIGVLMFDNSTNVILDTYPKVFSNM